MRIAFVMGSFPELSTTFILDQITGLIDLGHDVHILAREPWGKQLVHADIARYQLETRTHYWWASLDGLRKLVPRTLRIVRDGTDAQRRALLRSFDALHHGPWTLTGRWWNAAAVLLTQPPFDVVLAQFGTNGRAAVTLRDIGLLDAPIATTWLGYDLSRIIKTHGKGYYASLFARGDLQLPLSAHFRERLIGLGCPAEKISVHPLGIDPRRFAFTPPTPPQGGAPVRIITVCRLVEKKGLEYALRALVEVARRGHAFEYHVVGSGPLREPLEALARELGLSQVTFHGAQTRDAVVKLLAGAHVFLAPSVTARDGDEEGVPTAIKEAMAVGLPVVSTYHAAIPELITDDVSGMLVAERDVPALAHKLTAMITAPERWRAMTEAARGVIERTCDIATLNVALARTLQGLADDYEAVSRSPASAPRSASL
ncbi:MAG: glycosyltransferase [Polyangiales bacterium]